MNEYRTTVSKWHQVAAQLRRWKEFSASLIELRTEHKNLNQWITIGFTSKELFYVKQAARAVGVILQKPPRQRILS